MLGGEGAEEHLGSLGELQDGASQHSEENYIFNINQALRNRKRENGGISNDCFSIDPWIILDHPYTTRQGRKDTDDDTHCSRGDRTEQCKDKEDSKLHFNTRKMSHARGHIVHSWDVLLDMGTQGLEFTLPQLLEGSCKSQTMSSLSFGSKGGKSVDLDIITNLVAMGIMTSYNVELK